MPTNEPIPDLHAFPWRVCLAGGWLDQPWVSKLSPGGVIVVNVDPDQHFKTRSGLATSSRTYGMGLWGTRTGGQPPDEKPEQLARWLFNVENPIDVPYVSGSQDALGLMLPGINYLEYDGTYWPRKITSITDPGATQWLQKVLWLVPLPSRPPGYNPLKEKNLTPEITKDLAAASKLAWEAIQTRNAPQLGRALTETMRCWRAMLPETVPMPRAQQWIEPYTAAPHLGCLFSGAGGGFLMVVSETETPQLAANAFKLSIRTKPWKATDARL